MTASPASRTRIHAQASPRRPNAARRIDASPSKTVIDCSAITFMDSAAYHALLEAHEYAIDHDHVLVIRSLNPACARLVSLCDPDGVLTISS